MPLQFVAEVVRFKISRDVWKYSKSRRVVCFIEGSYKNKIIKSHDAAVYEGAAYCIPSEALERVQLNFFFIDALLTMDIGMALYSLQAFNQSLGSAGGSEGTEGTEVVLMIYPRGSTVAVGKVLLKMSVQDMFDDERVAKHGQGQGKVPGQVGAVQGLEHNFAVPGFRFKRLSRVLHWDRLRSLDVTRVVERNDSDTLLTLLDDVTTGDVSQEDCDPPLYKALNLAQYGAQYLISCRRVLKDREKVLKQALKTFHQEEELLDLKLAKLRAREKGLTRESGDMDEVSMEYSAALRDANPRLVDRLYETCREQLRGRDGGRDG
ncbi:hypothetical protein B484DRAFT_394850, partial [Ochromonadaceae sp. CCMP2298]